MPGNGCRANGDGRGLGWDSFIGEQDSLGFRWVYQDVILGRPEVKIVNCGLKKSKGDRKGVGGSKEGKVIGVKEGLYTPGAWDVVEVYSEKYWGKYGSLGNTGLDRIGGGCFGEVADKEGSVV